jgi:hypothetical protein
VISPGSRCKGNGAGSLMATPRATTEDEGDAKIVASVDSVAIDAAAPGADGKESDRRNSRKSID